MFFGYNRTVACELPDAKGPIVVSTPGLKQVVNANRLIGAKVVYGIPSEHVLAGDTVYVKGNQMKPVEIEFEGQKLVLIDLGTVVLVQHEPTSIPRLSSLD